MYNIYNSSNVFYLYDISKEKISLIGNEQDLIIFLAKGYRSFWLNSEYYYHNIYFDNFVCSENNATVNKIWQFFDGFGRCINPTFYQEEAYNLWISGMGRSNYKYWRKNKRYKGFFRRTPVEGIRKYRGGPPIHPRKVRHLHAMYNNPEYKKFNRGSYKYVPYGWWDDWDRSTERNWKSQRKHQWKERRGDM